MTPHPRWLRVAPLLLLALACNRLETTPRAPTPDGPSVLLVTIDTLRADHVGAYGAAADATPVLDALAAEGTRFETAIAPAPLTLPSHATLLTGLLPPRHGVRHNGIFRLGEDVPTLAERFSGAGHATGAVVAAVVLAERYGLGRGFDHYDDEIRGDATAARGYLHRRAEGVTDRALEWLAGRDGPFFLWVHYYDPHADYDPPPPFAERFAESPYAGEIAYVDRELGRLLDGLREAGRFDDTLVVATSDHGEALGEHGERTHSYTLYDATLAVPLLLRGPGVPAGRVVEDVVSLADVTPTLLAAAGLPALPGDGRDLAGFWSGDPPPDRAAYAETLATRLAHGWSPLHALRTDTWFYVRAPRPELYAVEADPDQLENLWVESRPPAVTQAGERLDALVSEHLAATREAPGLAMDARTRAELESLGYLLPGGSGVEETLLDPKDGLEALLWFDAGVVAYEADRFGEARALFERTLAALPESARVRELLAMTLLRQGEARRALDLVDEAVARLPESAVLRAIQGDARQMLGEAAAARVAYLEAERLDPTEPMAQVGLAGVRARAGDADAAAAHAERALAHAVDAPLVRVQLGLAWESGGFHDRARALYEEAVGLKPDFAFAHMLLAIQLARVDRVDEALRQRGRAGALGDDPRLVTRLARALASQGRTEAARRLLDGVLGRDPAFVPARRAREQLERAALPAAQAAP